MVACTTTSEKDVFEPGKLASQVRLLIFYLDFVPVEESPLRTDGMICAISHGDADYSNPWNSFDV